MGGFFLRVGGEDGGPLLANVGERVGGERLRVGPGLGAGAAPGAVDDADRHLDERLDVAGEIIADGGEVTGRRGRGGLPLAGGDRDRLIGDLLRDLDVADQGIGGGRDVDGLVVGAVEVPLHV